MSETCNHNCSSCGENCPDRDNEKKFDFSVPMNKFSNVKKVIGVVSGKGGVGKSLVTSLLASTMNKEGFKCAILDADITGPSIPKAFGIQDKATADNDGLYPAESMNGIKVMSTNLILENDTDPVVWRGPVIANTVKQFWSDVIWGDIDYMFIDMPPGTGDVPLTVFQSIPIDGIIVVTSPQELVSMIVTKALNMAELMHVPVIGLVENMSYFHCPDNGKNYNIFGDSHIDEIASNHNLNVLLKLPIDPSIAECCDKGIIETYENDSLNSVANILKNLEVR